MRRSKSRLLRLLVLILPALIVGSLSLLLIEQQGLTRSSEVAGVAGTAIALLAWLLGLWTSNNTQKDSYKGLTVDPADDLSHQIRTEWEDYLVDQSLHKPTMMRLRWSSPPTPAPNPHEQASNDSAAVHSKNQGLRGSINEVAEVFTQLQKRRLIILGAPGAGKTVMAIRLTIDLIKRRDSGGAVPVFLPIASWNPSYMDLTTWMIQRMAQNYYSANVDIPALLIQSGLIVPVLDGFDDIPKELRSKALHAIDRATHAELPIVITCRAEEYSQTIRNADTTLADSTVVEIEGVALPDAIAYLRASTPLYPNRWDLLYNYTAEHPRSSVAAALSTPLMVYLTKVMYTAPDIDPSELTDDRRFSSLTAIQGYLLQNYVEALYPQFPPRYGRTDKRRRWNAQKAAVWLSTLAAGLAHDKTTEFSWWRLDRRYANIITELINLAILILLITCGAYAFSTTFGHAHIGHTKLETWFFPAYGGLVGAAISITPIGVFRLAARGSAIIASPNRIQIGVWHAVPISIIGTFAILTGWMDMALHFQIAAVGFTLGFASGYAFWMLMGGASRREWRKAVTWSVPSRVGCSGIFLLALLLIGFQSWVLAETRSFWWWSLAGLPYVFLFGGKGSAHRAMRGHPPPMDIAGGRLFEAMRLSSADMRHITNEPRNWARTSDPDSSLRMARMASLVNFGLVASICTLAALVASGSRLPWVAVVIFAAGVGLGSAASSPWGRFVTILLWLWLRGRAPLRLMGFLRDATRRGILRQIGPSYQFRHIMVQKHLAGELDSEWGERRSAKNSACST